MAKHTLYIILVILSIIIFSFSSNLHATTIQQQVENVSIEDNKIIEKIDELKNKSSELLKNSTDIQSNLNSMNNITSPFGIISIFFKAVIVVLAINIFSKLFVKTIFNGYEIAKSRNKSKHLDKVLRDIYE